MKIKKGDTVMVLSGKDRAKTGKVMAAFPKKEQVLVEGVNIVTKHQKSRRRGQQGQIVKHEMPLHISNVALSGKGNKPVRVGYAFEGEGAQRKKVRVTRPDGAKA